MFKQIFLSVFLLSIYTLTINGGENPGKVEVTAKSKPNDNKPEIHQVIG